MTALSLRVRALCALGSMGTTALAAAISFHLLYFYTDVAGIPARTLGAALLFGRLWDMANDPLAGWLSDRTRSRWGRRRIYLLLTALPLGFSGWLLWVVPAGLSTPRVFGWVFLTYFIFDGFFTLASVPFSSLVASLSPDYDQRTSLAAWGAGGAWIGYVIGSSGVPLLVGQWVLPRAGFAWAGAALGAVAAASVLAAGIGLKEPPSAPLATGAGWRALWEPLRGAPFRRLLLATAVARVAFTVLMAGLPYLVTHWMGDSKRIAACTGFVMAAVGLSLPVWKKLAGRWEKGSVYAAGLALTGTAMIAFWWVPPGKSLWTWVLLGAAGMGLAAHWITPFAMVPDVIDWDQDRSGERRDGAHFGAMGAADKLARTVGFLGFGWGLAAVGYAGGAPSAKALTGFRLIFGPGTGILLLLAAALMATYPLTRAAHARLREKLSFMA